MECVCETFTYLFNFSHYTHKLLQGDFYRLCMSVELNARVCTYVSSTEFLLNMFRMLVHSSSGSCGCVWVYCSGSMCALVPQPA